VAAPTGYRDHIQVSTMSIIMVELEDVTLSSCGLRPNRHLSIAHAGSVYSVHLLVPQYSGVSLTETLKEDQDYSR
jgi:hypothetical protein